MDRAMFHGGVCEAGIHRRIASPNGQDVVFGV
jgi:hypothetical protein